MTIYQAKADLYFIMSDFEQSRAEGERLLALTRRIGDRVREGVALAGMGHASLYEHNFDQALVYARQAIEVAEDGNVKPILAAGHYVAARVYGVTGRHDQAKAGYDQALALSRSGDDVVHQSMTLCFIGFFKNWEGDFAEAVRLQADGLAIARAHHLVVPLLLGLNSSGVALTGQGNYDEALARFAEGLVLAEKVGAEIFCHRLLNGRGWLALECGDLDHAIEYNRQSAEGARRRGDHETIANAELNLGDAFIAKGDLALAQEFLDEISCLVQDPTTSDWMKWRYSIHLFASLGDFWLARGDPVKARECADQCLDIATRTNSRKYIVKGWRLLGEIALARRQRDEAVGWLQQALTLAQTIGNPTQLWKTHLALGRLYAETRQSEQARQAHRAAGEVIDRVKASVQNPELRASLEQSPLIQQVYRS
jgi:tetratricopeptide (TPR) repeat protein